MKWPNFLQEYFTDVKNAYKLLKTIYYYPNGERKSTYQMVYDTYLKESSSPNTPDLGARLWIIVFAIGFAYYYISQEMSWSQRREIEEYFNWIGASIMFFISFYVIISFLLVFQCEFILKIWRFCNSIFKFCFNRLKDIFKIPFIICPIIGFLFQVVIPPLKWASYIGLLFGGVFLVASGAIILAGGPILALFALGKAGTQVTKATVKGLYCCSSYSAEAVTKGLGFEEKTAKTVGAIVGAATVAGAAYELKEAVNSLANASVDTASDPTADSFTPQPDTIHVDGYYRQDGTYVHGHMRTKPDGILSNNLSAKK